jgi:hypothetical protein
MILMFESLSKQIGAMSERVDGMSERMDSLTLGQEEFTEFMRGTKEQLDRWERSPHREHPSRHQSPSHHFAATRNSSMSPIPIEPYRRPSIQPPGNYASVEQALNATRAERLQRSGLEPQEPRSTPFHQSPGESRRVFFGPTEFKQPAPWYADSFDPPTPPSRRPNPRDDPEIGVPRPPGSPHRSAKESVPPRGNSSQIPEFFQHAADSGPFRMEHRKTKTPTRQAPETILTPDSMIINHDELPRPNPARGISMAPSAAPSATPTVITSRVHKIPSELFIELDPKKGATDLYFNNLRHLATLYGDQSVIAGIPRSLQGRARDWWTSNPMTVEEMSTVEGWIDAIGREFPVYVPRAKAEAMAYKYRPTEDLDVLDYFYAKINKLRSAQRSMRDSEIIDYVWEGLPPGLQKLLDYAQLSTMSLTEVGRSLGNKDLAYREEVLSMEKYHAIGDRSKDRRYGKSTADAQVTSVSFKPSSKTPKIGTKTKNKGKEKSTELPPIPDPLPREQWKADKQGRTMTRKCRFCGQWHFDFDCPKRPTSYSLTTIVSESLGQLASSAEGSTDESNSDESSSSDDEHQDSSNPASYCTVPIYSTELPRSSQSVRIPKAEDYIIDEVERLPVMGTGVAYLSAEPCPIQAWIGQNPDSNTPIITGVADSGGPSIIQKDLIPPDCTINPSPMNPSFQGIGNHTTDVLGYVLLPVHLPNQAALDGNSRKARILKLWIEFQVVDNLAAGFLIGRDALKGYKAIIDEEVGYIIFRITQNPFFVPILKRKYHNHKVDSRIFATQSVHIRPRSEAWVPITFDQSLMESTNDVLITPARKNTGALQIHASCPYSIISKTTTHVLYLNPSDRPTKIGKGEVIAYAKPIEANTPMSYFGTPCPSFFSTVFSNHSSSIDQSLTSNLQTIFDEGKTVAAPPIFHGDSSSPSTDDPILIDIGHPTTSVNEAPIDDINSHIEALQNTIKSDTVKLEWHPYVSAIDPLGMEHEFRDSGPLLPQSMDDEDKQEGDLEWDICPKLTRRQRRDWIRMLRKHLKMFAGPGGRNLGRVSSKYDMDIDADPSTIKSQQPYRTSPRKRRLIREAINKLLELNIIQPSSSSIASPVVVVVQKGKPRFCVDLREVNSKTIPDRYSLPRQDSIFRALAGAIFFSTMDCNKGYHQFGLTERAQKLTAFVTEDGFWEYVRMPFGLKNAPAHFQRTMDAILGIYRWDFALAYIDDIIVYSKTFEEHMLHCSLILEALESIGMTLDEKKCHWAYLDVDLLGHHISRLGLATQAEKVKAILAVPFPETIKKAQEILGMFNYYRIFIEYFAWIAGPLYDGLKGSEIESTSAVINSKQSQSVIHGRNKFPDTPATREAFEKLRQALTSAPVLINPDFDKEFILYTDACGIGIAGNLHQIWDEDGKEHPVLYISRRLNSHEAKYTSTELECLGVVWCLNKLAHYVDGSKLKLVTDHNALKWIWGIKTDVNARLFKWSLQLSMLKDKVTIVHRPGRFHQNVDVLSRNPSSNSITHKKVQSVYSVTPIHLSEEWKEKLWKGYLTDSYFRRVISSLQRLMIDPNSVKKGESTTQITEISENVTPTSPTIASESASIELSLQKFAQQQQEQPTTITDGIFTLIGRTLYFSTHQNQSLRLCIPKGLIKEILHLNHDLAGHPGVRRTFSAIYLRYHFPKMFRQIKHYCNNCSICQTSKPSNERPYGSLYPIQTEEPFHTLSFDFIMDLPVSHGKNALLTVTDKFTKAIRLIACVKTTTAEDTARLHIDSCYSIFGLPVKIISDRDARFTSRFWSTLMHLLGISQGLTSAFHPSADGQAEKTNQVVEIALRCFLAGDVTKYSRWTEYLPILEHEYNSMTHESTGYSPNQLRFAIQPRGIMDLATPPTKGSSEAAESWAEELKCIREEARDSLRMAQRKQKKYADGKKKRKVFNVGDLVLLKYNRFGPGYKPPKRHNHKLAPIASPLRITERLSPISYRLQLPAGSRIHDVISIHHLRRYRGSGEDIRPLPIIIDDEEHWKVDKVEGERIRQGRTEFLVRWEGYGDDDRSWEPLENLEYAQDSILEWRSTHPDMKTISSRKTEPKSSMTKSSSASTHPMRTRLQAARL